ncbi:helix-turn-helix transcriptional regulator [candidate division KSB1 bacterium]|nr:helix-turn-helix transcriptional regulator [candidate division KSB1 bacterium]
MKLNLIDIISIITIFQLLLLAVFLIINQKGKPVSNRLLAAMLLINAIFIIRYQLFDLNIIHVSSFPRFYYLGNALYILIGVLLYLYTRSLCFCNFTLRRKHFVHLAPYALLAVYVYWLFWDYSPSAASMTTFHQRLFFYGMVHLSLLIYIILTFRTVLLYQSELKNMYASIHHIDLSWLLIIVLGFALMWLTDVIAVTGALFNIGNSVFLSILNYISLSINLIFACAIVYKGLKHPQVFNGIDERIKYAHSRLTPDESSKHIQKLLVYMTRQKPYLSPDISLNDLAQKLSISPRYLSQGLNEVVQQNFYDFINGYRIEEAKQLMQTTTNQKKTILEILYEVGFNSKSVFNTAFKKHTGMTPTEFKRKYSH